MDILKQIFPFSFGKKPDVTSLVITLILHLVASLAVSIVCALFALFDLGFLDFLAWLIGTVSGAYITGGIVLTFLHYFKVIK